MKYLMVFALMCGLGLLATVEAKEVPAPAPVAPAPAVVAPAPAPVAPAPAVAAPVVPDIRVGGEIRLRHIDWGNMFFGFPATGIVHESWFDTRTRLLVEADLAKDATAVVRLSNERDWGDPEPGEFDVLLDWAYLTANVGIVDLTIGRQPIKLADSMQIDATFDAVRLSVPFAPVVLDAFFAKIADARDGTPADDDLMGIQLVYRHPRPAITANIGYYGLSDRGISPVPNERVRSVAISGRGLIAPLLVDGGVIFQTGDVVDAGALVDLDAGAFYFGVGGALHGIRARLSYFSLSGDDPLTAKYEGFQPMFEDVDYGEIIDELDDAPVWGALGVDNLNTNLDLWGLSIGASPMPGVGIGVRYAIAERNKVGAGISKDLGTELSFGASYALTKDVRFGLLMARFTPDDFWTTAVSPALGMTKTSTLTGVSATVNF